MSTNIDDLLQKQNNPEQVSRTADVPDSQKLNAQEFIRMVTAIKENQNSAKAVKMDGVTHYPNESGVVTLPNPSSIQGDVYTSRIEVAPSFNTTNPRVVKERVLQIPIKFMAILTSGGERLNAGISGTLHIERSTNNFSTASEVGSLFMQSRDADASSYDTIDIGQYLQEGEQQFRFYATYQYIDENGETKVATSPYTSLATVTLTDMQLVFSGNWQRPFSGGSIDVGYFVSGYGQMLLYVEVDGTMVVNGRQVTTSTETAVNVSITTASLLTNGLHTIRAWLASAIDTTVTSDVQESQVLYFDASTATTIEKQTAYVMISNVAQNVTPYVETHLFDYAVYKYGAETVQLEILFTNSTNTTTYLSHDLGNVAVGGESHNEYNNALQIPAGVTTAYMRLKVNGSIQQGRYWSLAIDQSINFSPTTIDANGFIFDASSRSNEEDHPERVINARNGEVVAAQWSSGMKFSPSSGYIEPEGDVKHLHIPAGEWLKITGYDPMVFSDSMTMEFDVKISNVYDEKIPVIRVGRETVNGILGFEMLPLTAYLMTEQQHARGSQDIQIGEDERTHIAVNIIRNLGGRGVNFVRLFVNGIINREFIYGDDDSFVSQSGSGGIQIGSTKAEVDVYSIRVYKTALSSNNIRQDYLSTIPTANEKVGFYRRNNILGGDNTISYDLTKQLYSTMLWIPDDTSKAYLPSYRTGANVSFSKGTLKVIFRYRYNTNGHQKGEINYDLSRIYTHMKIKGQGTSSMTYWTWNLRFQFSEASEVWSMTPSLEKNAVLLSNVGKIEDEWECYGIFEEGGAHATKLDAKANWASSSQSHKMGMMNSYGDLWKQIIGVRNPIYDSDRKTRPCVLQEAFMFFVQDANGNADLANLGEDSSFIRFSNFMTFGPAKNDKATWGTGVKSSHYIKSGAQKSMYTCLEGSSNGRPLAEAKIPWIPEEVFYYFNTADEEDPMNETFIYNGDSQFDFDKGPADEQTYGANKTYDVPKGFTQVPNTVMWQETSDMNYNSSDIYLCSGNTVKFYRRAFNFAYLNTHHLEVVEGDYNDFMDMVDGGLLDNNKQYFVMNNGGGHSKGDCFRYNPLSEKNPSLPKWVNAGITKSQSTDDGYAVLNLLTDLSDYMPSSYNPNDAISLRDAFITARLKRYRGNGTSTGSSLYWDEVECDLCQAWGKVMAAKDNWCKNTYFVLRPDGKLTMYRDDDDTIMDKDNVGKTGTPYQVEEHDRYNDDGVWADENGKGEIWDKTTGEYNDVTNPRNTYWNSQDSVLFTLREQTRGGYRSDMGDEMRLMVGTIFQTMMLQDGSVDAFFQKHFFDIQEYFPAVAYNEVARLLYEEAKIHMDANVYSGRELYTNNTDPITQSLGDQLQGEKQWIKRRIPYMESFGHSSIFADSHGAGALSFRSSLASTDLGSTHGYVFRVTPHQFLYPAAGSESSTVFSSNRTRPSEEVALPTLTVTQNNNVFIYGINYLRSVGDFAPHPTEPNSSIGVVGERLEEWIINEDGSQTVENRSASISLSTPRLQRLVMRNCTSLNSLGGSSLRNLSRLVSVDLRGCTSLSAVVTPSTYSIEEIKLPAHLTSFSISDTPNLNTLTFDGFVYMTSLTLGRNIGSTNVQTILTNLYNTKKDETNELRMLNYLSIVGIDLRNVVTNFMLWLTRIPNLTISGRIALSSNESLMFESKRTLINKFGNIDDENNILYVTYSQRIATALKIQSPFTIRTAGTYQTKLLPTNIYANDFIRTELIVPENSLGITYNETTEQLIVPAVSDIPFEITLTGRYYNDVNNPTTGYIEVTKTIPVYDRQAEVGDYVYANGEYSNLYDNETPIVGVCFYVSPDKSIRLAMALKVITLAHYNSKNASNGSITQSNDSFVWGMDNNKPAITLVDNVGYDTYGGWAYYASKTGYLDFRNNAAGDYLDSPTDADGFHVYEDTNVFSQLGAITLEEDLPPYHTGDKIPYGEYQTLRIIRHRNTILNDSGVNLPIPAATAEKSELQVLGDLLNACVEATNYSGQYYPVTSAAYAYEPNVGDFELNDKFKCHKWFLPSAGEAARYAFYATRPTGDANAKFDRVVTELGSAFDLKSKQFWTSSRGEGDTRILSTFRSGGEVAWNSANIIHANCARPIVKF